MKNSNQNTEQQKPFSDTDYRNCFREGYQAAQDGARRTEVPYHSDQDQETAAWLDGYDQFHQDS